jgi:hypothetical protein
MLSVGNPAEQLHLVLSQFQQHSHAQKTVDDCWAESLDVPAADVPDVLGPLLGLIPKVSTTLESLGRPRLLQTCERYKAAWSKPFLSRQNGSANLVDDDSMHALLGIAETISQSGRHRVPISDAEQRRLSELLQEAREEVLQDLNLPRELRALMLSRIGEMLWALDHLQVVGMDGLQEAMERLTTVVGTAPKPVREKTAWKKAVVALGAAWVVFSHGADVQDNLEAWREILPGIEHAIEQHSPKQIEGSASAPRDDEPAPDVIDGEVLEE